MSWLTRLLGRDRDQEQRIADAHAQREDAAEVLEEARELARHRRELISRNHITEGFAAAFERRERHA